MSGVFDGGREEFIVPDNEPGVGVFWPAFIVFAYALGLFIAMVT